MLNEVRANEFGLDVRVDRIDRWPVFEQWLQRLHGLLDGLQHVRHLYVGMTVEILRIETRRSADQFGRLVEKVGGRQVALVGLQFIAQPAGLI